MPNFETFKCTVCNRATEKPVSQKHAPINRCDITAKCRGVLTKIGSSDTKTMAAPSAVEGISNWAPRHASAATQAFKPVPTLCLDTDKSVLTFAVPSSRCGIEPDIAVRFEAAVFTNKQYTEYVFGRPSGTALVSGQDDSSKRVALRFSNTDQVSVFVNGVELPPHSYDRSVLNRLVFTPALLDDSNSINVLVTKANEPVFITGFAHRHGMPNAPAGAWDNIVTVTIRGIAHTLFSIAVRPGINTGIIVAAIGNWVQDVGLLLLANEPYSHFDRALSTVVSIPELIASREIIDYKNNVKGIAQFTCTFDSVSGVIPGISINAGLSPDANTNKVHDTNNMLTNMYIT